MWICLIFIKLYHLLSVLLKEFKLVYYGPFEQRNINLISDRASQEVIKCTNAKEFLLSNLYTVDIREHYFEKETVGFQGKWKGHTYLFAHRPVNNFSFIRVGLEPRFPFCFRPFWLPSFHEFFPQNFGIKKLLSKTLVW